MTLHQDMNVYELKKLLCEKLREHDIVDTVPEKIRLRDRVGERLNTMYCNENTIKQQCKALYDKKVLCITLLDQEEITSKSDIIVYSKAWDIINFSFSEVREHILPNFTTMSEIGKLLSIEHNIPVNIILLLLLQFIYIS